MSAPRRNETLAPDGVEAPSDAYEAAELEEAYTCDRRPLVYLWCEDDDDGPPYSIMCDFETTFNQHEGEARADAGCSAREAPRPSVASSGRISTLAAWTPTPH